MPTFGIKQELLIVQAVAHSIKSSLR